MKGSAKISTSSGVAQAGPLMGIWCDGKKWRARPSGYKGKDGEKIEPKAKQKRMDRDDVGALHQLDNVVRDALMAVLFDKRMYYRSQYDGDEQRQQQGRNTRRSTQAKKCLAQGEASAHHCFECVFVGGSGDSCADLGEFCSGPVFDSRLFLRRPSGCLSSVS